MNPSLIKKNSMIPELSIVRAIAIIGVLSVHSTSVAVSTGMIDSNLFFLYNFANIFLKFGTTTFIFLSSFVLFYNYYSRPITKELIGSFYKKRMLYIIVPYVVFSLFYFFLKYYLGSADLSIGQMLTKLGNQLLNGTAHAHLYFVFISIQFYIVFPLFLWIFQKKPGLTKWLIVIGILIQWSFILINKYGLETPVLRRGSWSLSYFSYYFMGAYIGIYFNELKRWIVVAKDNITKKRLTIWISTLCLWLIAGLYHVYIYFQIRQHSTRYNTTWMDFVWNAHALLTAIVLLQLAFILYRKLPNFIRGLVTQLGEYSFGIYLFHPFLLLIYRKFEPVTGNIYVHHLWYLGGFIVALVGSWVIVGLFARFIPQHWIVFGKLPKIKRKKTLIEKEQGVQL
ncbi:MAG TPA: acyltransferase [Candidatus Paenibacillus intestinavium]|nr:acyltransferase [Candidatus Paenibacillus intestinavium]